MAAHRSLVGGPIGLNMTPNWGLLLDEASLASVLPAELTQFARPVRDGLAVFLAGLPPEFQAAILLEQADLPQTATISQRLGVLARHCPVLQKLGQVLARDRRLSPELRGYLCQLESAVPTVPWGTVQQTLTQELGPLHALGIELQSPAIAEASVAVVVPFRRTARHGRTARENEGVFKVLKPGIEQRLHCELELLEKVGEYLDQRCDELRIPHLDYQATFQHVRDKLQDEVQLGHEQRHLREAKAFFADETSVQIPELFEHCTPRVTAMERIHGVKVTGHQAREPGSNSRLARLVARQLIAKPIFSTTHVALFHADPHAGNLFWTDDGRLAILDWSLVGRLEEWDRVAVVQIMLGAITLDVRRIVAVLKQMAVGQVDSAILTAVVTAWVRRICEGQLPGVGWLVGLLDEATQRARLRVPPDLMLFRKSLLTLEGVVAEIGDADGQIDRVLRMEFLRHFVREWPQRWLHLPSSRDFATRLSNLDLTDTILNCPLAAARFWSSRAADILNLDSRSSGIVDGSSSPGHST